MYQSTNQIFTFLPVEGRRGRFDHRANVSAALARRPNTRVLLADFDLSSGMLRFMLKLTNEFSVPDAISREPATWTKICGRSWSRRLQGMDVLHAGRINPSYRIDAAQVAKLIAFMRRTYQALCFDLQGIWRSIRSN